MKKGGGGNRKKRGSKEDPKKNCSKVKWSEVQRCEGVIKVNRRNSQSYAAQVQRKAERSTVALRCGETLLIILRTWS